MEFSKANDYGKILLFPHCETDNSALKKVPVNFDIRMTSFFLNKRVHLHCVQFNFIQILRESNLEVKFRVSQNCIFRNITFEKTLSIKCNSRKEFSPKIVQPQCIFT